MQKLGFLVVGVALMGAGCAASQPESTTPAGDTGAPAVVPAAVAPAAEMAPVVAIQDYAFVPAKLVVKKGTTVTWTNKDIAKHTVTGDTAGEAASPFFGQNGTFVHKFEKVGTFSYHCEPHPYMKAVVEVTE